MTCNSLPNSDGVLLPIQPAILQDTLDELHARYQSLKTGTPANYIPELAKMDPDWFSICIVTVTGEQVDVGDAQQLFTIQSISKVFVYGLALEDHGRERVLSKVGVEPTGDAFNAIVLDERSKRPYNPMVNAGAIATTSLIKGKGPTERLNRMMEMFERYIGHESFIDMPTFMSERTTGHRNRAMAHLMYNFGMIDEKLDEALDLYFQQCSLMVNCHDLAVMAATLANRGKNPLTGVQAVSPGYVRDILSVMYTCGMYNFAGEWAYTVGLPAKSGVSGGLIVVVPNRMGIAVFSPPLDERGNSVRGVQVCEELSQRFGLHLFDCSSQSEAAVSQHSPNAEPQLDQSPNQNSESGGRVGKDHETSSLSGQESQSSPTP
ncbi:MAG: glutaminase A [Synechococcales cyanobacterium C42_A2020_086]|nr:glutaminase A [Synechococcales cyanobacterium C42_A2020_086]